MYEEIFNQSSTLGAYWRNGKKFCCKNCAYGEKCVSTQGLSGMGQVVPGVTSDAMRQVILASVGIVAVSVTFYMLFGPKRGAPSGATT